MSLSIDAKDCSIITEDGVQPSFEQIMKKVEWNRNKGRKIVVVQGLGFVGTAVAAVIADAKDSIGQALYCVIGIDLATAAGLFRVTKINEGISPILSPDKELSILLHTAVHDTKNLFATVSEEIFRLADIIVVDVPLDVYQERVESEANIKVDLETFKAAIRSIGRNMRFDALVIIETTVPLGSTEQIALPILQSEREQRNLQGPICLAHAYERVMPGPNYVDSIRRYWRTFSGIDEVSIAKAREFLSSFIDTDSYPLWNLEDTVSSEMAKLLENSYRAVNIALIYEWSLLAEEIGINLFSVIDSIRVRRGTHDNMRLPGFGVGGYCLTKDSLLAQWSARYLFENDVILKMTLDAIRINYKMPLHTLALLAELFEKGLSRKTVIVCGVSYLPEVADTRNSPTELLVDELLKNGADVIVHDPYVTNWPEKSEININNDLLDCAKIANAIVFAVPHLEYRNLAPEKLIEISQSPLLIVDAQNIITDEKAEIYHKAGCRLLGVGKGHWRKRGYQWKK